MNCESGVGWCSTGLKAMSNELWLHDGHKNEGGCVIVKLYAEAKRKSGITFDSCGVRNLFICEVGLKHDLKYKSMLIMWKKFIESQSQSREEGPV
jgi:hypothetical protein